MDIADWLRSLGLEQYEAAFRDNAIDSAVSPRLTRDDLKDIGVTQVGHRRELLDAIAALVEPAPTATPAAVDPISQATTAAPLGGARRQLTVMFCDLVGSTALVNCARPDRCWWIHSVGYMGLGKSIRKPRNPAFIYSIGKSKPWTHRILGRSRAVLRPPHPMDGRAGRQRTPGSTLCRCES